MEAKTRGGGRGSVLLGVGVCCGGEVVRGGEGIGREGGGGGSGVSLEVAPPPSLLSQATRHQTLQRGPRVEALRQP